VQFSTLLKLVFSSTRSAGWTRGANPRKVRHVRMNIIGCRRGILFLLRPDAFVATNNPLGLAFIERRVSNVAFRLRFARQE
jgi:hypothetical protein